MIRSLFVFALAGTIFFTAIPALAAEEPATVPSAPTAAASSVSAASIHPINQPVNTAAERSGASGQSQAVRNARQQAPSATPTSTVTGTATGTVTGAVTSTVAGARPVTATAGVTGSNAPTLTAPAAGDALTATQAVTGLETITSSSALTQSVILSATATPDPSLDEQYAGVLEGTIIANRTEANVRFFVEGQVYDLAPLRAVGLPLPRPTAVLNLFNCDARQSEEDAGCFWDPYLLKQNGFFEVVNGDESGALVSLILREAGAPPADQIWVQNRTGERESILVGGQPVEIAPASVEQFTLEGTDPVVFHVRNCITQGEQTACEWAPQNVERGYYYSLVKLTSAGANNMTVSTTKLEGIVASTGEVVEQPPQASCVLRVPTLNVRSGPGLEFPVIAKVRGTEEEPGSVVVVGYDATQQWMQVSDRIAQGGWVTSNPDFIICTGDLAALPVAGGAPAAASTEAAAAEATAAPEAAEEAAAETPADTAAAEAPVVEAAPEAPPAEAAAEAPAAAPVEATAEAPAEATAEATEAAPAPPAIPAGQARITVYNQFDRVIRFTMDQKYRSDLNNPTGEWDLEPGQSVSILVFPGMVPYSVSSPWNGLSANANLNLNPDEDRALYVTFIPDPDGSGDWILQSW